MGFYVKGRLKVLFAALAAIVLVSSCSGLSGLLGGFTTGSVRSTDDYGSAGGILGSKHLVREFEKYSTFHKHDFKVIVTTFVDLNDFNKTSDFGRLISESVMSELAKRGYKVVEVRESTSLQIIKDVGELFLVRDVQPEKGLKKDILPKNYKEEYVGDLIIVGTYQAGSEVVTINARVINPETSDILTVASYQMARTAFIDELLAAETAAQAVTLPSVEVRKEQ
jgi:TolB-like protein